MLILYSKAPPIIILRTDHGSDLYYSFAGPEKSCLKERFLIFGAYYLPGKSKDIIHPDITPVNLFQIIFNEHFGAELPPLDIHNYATVGHNLFAGLKKVTGSVEIDCEISRN